MNFQEAQAAYRGDVARLAAGGIHIWGAKSYVPDGWAHDSDAALMAMDAQTTLQTDPSSGIPTMLTTVIDPEIIRVVQAPLAMAEIVGERKKGDWLTETEIFPVVEMTGEVSTYGDFNNNGRAGINMNWPQFQSYLFQTTLSYGEKEIGRAGLAKINYVSELGVAAAYQLNQFLNLIYAFGLVGLQNYGIINNPFLGAALTPSTKAAGGTGWFSGNNPNATANEVYNDIAAMIQQLIVQTNGLINAKSEMTLALSPGSEQALTFVNAFGVFVIDLLKKGYPGLTVKSAPQYGTQTTANPQGYSAAGNTVQLIATTIQGQQVAYGAFNEKLRTHKIIADLSAWKQKQTSGGWGTILRMPVGVVTMIGV